MCACVCCLYKNNINKLGFYQWNRKLSHFVREKSVRTFIRYAASFWYGTFALNSSNSGSHIRHSSRSRKNVCLFAHWCEEQEDLLWCDSESARTTHSQWSENYLICTIGNTTKEEKSIWIWFWFWFHTCLPHFQSGPRITRAPTPSIVKRGGRLTIAVLPPPPPPPPPPFELLVPVVVDVFAFCVSICGAEQAIWPATI